jgi:hypothetical protein
MHQQTQSPETLALFVIYAGIVATTIVAILFYIRTKWEKPKGTIIHRREVRYSTMNKDNEAFGIYECEECGAEQHGSPPCEMCGSECMKMIR